MTYVYQIIEKFGGVRAMARRLGRAASTVNSWADRGSIPDAEKATILALAQRDNIGLTAVDFFPFERMPAPDGETPETPAPENKDAA